MNLDSITPYLKDLEALPRLSTNELSNTIDVYYLTKSISARNRLTEHFLSIIPQMLIKYSNQGIPLPDLIQEASIKLIEVLDALPGLDIPHTITDTRRFIIRSIDNRVKDLLRAQKSYNQTLDKLREL